MTWCEQLTRRAPAPEWRGPAQVHLKLSAGDEVAPAEQGPAPKERACSKCKVVKPLTPDFFYRNSRATTGFLCECKACHKERDRFASQRDYRKRNGRA